MDRCDLDLRDRTCKHCPRVGACVARGLTASACRGPGGPVVASSWLAYCLAHGAWRRRPALSSVARRMGRQSERAAFLEIGRAHRLNSSHPSISYAVFCLKKKKTTKLSTKNKNKHHTAQLPTFTIVNL